MSEERIYTDVTEEVAEEIATEEMVVEEVVEEPTAEPAEKVVAKKGFAKAALVFGILAFITTLFLINYVFGILSLIFGIIYLANVMGEKAVSDFVNILIKTNNTKGIIIDLRNNYGGILANAVLMADFMVPDNKKILKDLGLL